MLVNIQSLIDEAKCYEAIRAIIGLQGVRYTKCDSRRVIKQLYVVAGHKGQLEVVHSKGRKGRCHRLKAKQGRGTLTKEKPPIFEIIQRQSPFLQHNSQS